MQVTEHGKRLRTCANGGIHRKLCGMLYDIGCIPFEQAGNVEK